MFTNLANELGHHLVEAPPISDPVIIDALFSKRYFPLRLSHMSAAARPKMVDYFNFGGVRGKAEYLLA